jgi:hypothetical protein
VELRDLHLTEETLTYKVEVLDGTLSAKAGPCSRKPLALTWQPKPEQTAPESRGQ